MLKITIDSFYQNPKKFKYCDIRKLLLKCGCKERKTKGSHVKFKHSNFGKNEDIIIPVHNEDCKNFTKQKHQK